MQGKQTWLANLVIYLWLGAVILLVLFLVLSCIGGS